MKLEFSRQICENTQSNFVMIRSGGAVFSLRTDGQADMTKLTAAFRNFFERAKNQPTCHY